MRRRSTRSRRTGGFDAPTEEGAPTTSQTVSVKRALAEQIEQAMMENGLTKAQMARRMATSRSQLNRLLDPNSDSVTLETLTRAAKAVGRKVRVELLKADQRPDSGHGEEG